MTTDTAILLLLADLRRDLEQARNERDTALARAAQAEEEADQLREALEQREAAGEAPASE